MRSHTLHNFAGRLVQLLYSMMDMETNKTSLRAPVDVDRLIHNFNTWEEATAEAIKENSQLSYDLKILQKSSALQEQAISTLEENNAASKESVDSLQAMLSKRCDMEEENGHLKEQILAMRTSAAQLEEEHKKQMMEALENLQTVHDAHKKDMAQAQDSANQQMHQELKVLEKTIQEKNMEIKRLQKQNAEPERAKHTEVVKLRLEYDAKMLKLQKQNTRSHSAQPSSVNNDIFRRKLQNAKAEADREISLLRKRVAELERQSNTSSSGPLSSNNKRRKIL